MKGGKGDQKYEGRKYQLDSKTVRKRHKNEMSCPRTSTPTNCFERRSPLTKGRTFQAISELSIELVKREDPSGLRLIPVMVSRCPSMMKATSCRRRSHAWTTLPMPAVKM